MDNDVRESPTWRRNLVIVCVSLIIVALAGLAVWEHGRNQQWWGETDLLKALKASPLADEQLVGHQHIPTEQSEPVGFMGLRKADFYDIWYDPGTEDPVRVRDQIIALAQRDGFSPDPATSTDHYINLSLTGSDGSVMRASIRVAQAGDPLSSPDLVGSVLVQLYYSK